MTAITPKEALSVIDNDKFDYAVKELNEMIFNKMKNNEYTVREDNCFMVEVITSDKFNLLERKIISEEFVRSGWDKVESITSAENGERPGLILFKFYGEI